MNEDLNILTKEDIKYQAPVVLASSPTADVSDQYTFVDTEQVIDDMGELGWFPTQVSQRASRKKSTRFSPHLVRFSNPDLKITRGEGEDESVSYPQILLNNRHDGLGSFRIQAGIYRLVCSNGLVIATAKFGELKIAHRGYSFNEIREVVRQRVEALPEQIQVMNTMKGKFLSRTEMEELARQAIVLRSNVQPGTEEAQKLLKNVDKVSLNELLSPVRPEDKGNNLWNTYQIAQERLTKGLFHMPMGPKAKVRKVREINSFEKDLDFNRKLFTTAKSFLEV